MMTPQEFATYTHEQEIHRLLVMNERLRAQRDKWHDEALDKSRDVGRLMEENHRLHLELEAARQEIRRLKGTSA